jgi:hypothetical protein
MITSTSVELGNARRALGKAFEPYVKDHHIQDISGQTDLRFSLNGHPQVELHLEAEKADIAFLTTAKQNALHFKAGKLGEAESLYSFSLPEKNDAAAFALVAYTSTSISKLLASVHDQEAKAQEWLAQNDLAHLTARTTCVYLSKNPTIGAAHLQGVALTIVSGEKGKEQILGWVNPSAEIQEQLEALKRSDALPAAASSIGLFSITPAQPLPPKAKIATIG